MKVNISCVINFVGDVLMKIIVAINDIMNTGIMIMNNHHDPQTTALCLVLLVACAEAQKGGGAKAMRGRGKVEENC